MNILETLRAVDEHFQKLTRLDVPEQVRKFKNLGGDCHYEDQRTRYYDLWRRVRHAIKELEQTPVHAVPAAGGEMDATRAVVSHPRRQFPAIAKDEEAR